MRLLFLTEFYPTNTDADVRGGVELRTFVMTQGLAEKHEVTVVAEREQDTAFDDHIGKVRVVRPGPRSHYRQGGGLINRARYLMAARSFTLTQHPDVLIAENFGGYTIALTLSSAWRLKTILTYHDVWIGEWIKNVGLIMGLVGEVIERITLRQLWGHYAANSKVTRDKLIRFNVAPKQIDVVYNGIDVEQCHRVTPEKFSRPTIITVSRLVQYKRVDNLLRALVEVRKSGIDAQLVIIGSGPEEKGLKTLATSLGLDQFIEWRGFVPEYLAVLAAIKGATVFSFPTSVEGFGLVTAEAMACGTPYVSSDIAPTREVTNNGQGGLLYPVEDTQALVRGLVVYLTDPSAREAASRAGQERAQEFDRVKMIAAFNTLLNSLFAQKKILHSAQQPQT